jgi:hypothetical protein
MYKVEFQHTTPPNPVISDKCAELWGLTVSGFISNCNQSQTNSPSDWQSRKDEMISRLKEGSHTGFERLNLLFPVQREQLRALILKVFRCAPENESPVNLERVGESVHGSSYNTRSLLLMTPFSMFKKQFATARMALCRHVLFLSKINRSDLELLMQCLDTVRRVYNASFYPPHAALIASTCQEPLWGIDGLNPTYNVTLSAGGQQSGTKFLKGNFAAVYQFPARKAFAFLRKVESQFTQIPQTLHGFGSECGNIEQEPPDTAFQSMVRHQSPAAVQGTVAASVCCAYPHSDFLEADPNSVIHVKNYSTADWSSNYLKFCQSMTILIITPGPSATDSERYDGESTELLWITHRVDELVPKRTTKYGRRYLLCSVKSL